jgi:hypothetical protein
VLVPLAQSQASIDHWLDAVEVAGSATPLANPLFEGTVFIPSDEVGGSADAVAGTFLPIIKCHLVQLNNPSCMVSCTVCKLLYTPLNLPML